VTLLRVLLVLGLCFGLPLATGADHPRDDSDDEGGVPWSLILSLAIIALVAVIWIYSAVSDRRQASPGRRRSDRPPRQ
jgi:uncharacterized RDD family membrane protein YckC